MVNPSEADLREFGGTVPAPDDSTSIVGGRGSPLAQERDDRLVVRAGIESVNSDWDIDSLSITDQSDVVVADPEGIGGTSDMSGALQSDSGETFSLAVEWLADDDATLLYREEPDALQNTTDVVITAITVKSDHARVVVTDTSADGTGNVISGTLNFH